VAKPVKRGKGREKLDQHPPLADEISQKVSYVEESKKKGRGASARKVHGTEGGRRRLRSCILTIQKGGDGFTFLQSPNGLAARRRRGEPDPKALQKKHEKGSGA